MDTTNDDEALTARRRTRCGMSACAAGIAMAMLAALAGLAAMAGAAPYFTTGALTAVSLTTSESSWQPAFDDLVNAMQQAAAHDAALSYAPPGSDGVLTTMLQNTNYELLMSGLSRVTELFNGVFFQSPEAVAGDAADSRQYFDFFTPDIYYHVTAGLAPGATYALTGTLGGATENLSISTEAITALTAQTKQSIELGHGLSVNPDGTFTVYIGPDEPAGAVNYINDTDATESGDASLLVRDMLGNWAKGPADISIHCVSDCPAFFSIPSSGFFPGGDATAAVANLLTGAGGAKIDSVDSVLNLLLSAFSQIVGPFNQMSITNGEAAGILEPTNTMSPLAPETGFGAGLESAAVSAGNFDLEPGQALIVKMPDVPAAYSGIELMNVFGGGLPSTLAQTTLNNTTAFHDTDGYTYYVVSATNPGVANWLDSSGVTKGEIFARFENIPDGTDADGLDVTTKVVPVADLVDQLPADTPTVNPAEYAADMAQRVFSYDYALDSSRMHAQPGWVLQESLLYGLKGLMGSDNFQEAFGEQPSTPLALRFTDALSPDWSAVEHDIVTNPSDSLSALVNNLPLAVSDISLPMEFAVVRTALSLLLPGQHLGTVLDDALLGPNTGIIAGFLNARDDLATAVLNANNNFPTELGTQAANEWANMSDLVQSTPSMTLADLGALLLDPAEFFGG